MMRDIPLRYRFIAIVIIGAILPVAVVGGLAARSGVSTTTERLRVEQAERLDALAGQIQRRWQYRMGDLLLLAGNEETVRFIAAGRAPDDGEAEWLTAVWNSAAQEIPHVEFAGADGRTVWQLGTRVREEFVREGARGGIATPAATITVNAPATEFATGRVLGVVRAQVRTSSIIPQEAVALQAAEARLAVLYGDAGVPLVAGGELPASALRSDRFRHEGDVWVASRRRLLEPAVELIAAAPIGTHIEPYERAAWTAAAALALSALLVTALTIFLTGRATRGIRQLAEAADSVGSGDLSVRVQAEGHDEVGRLAVAFNRMAGGLEATLHELARQRALAATGELAASLSHEVRNALTSVRIDLERAGRTQTPTENRFALTTRALQNVTRLELIVAGLLKASRGDQLAATPIDILVPLHAAADTAALQSDAGVVIEDAPDVPLRIAGDGAALEQLFANLILNAMQAAPLEPVRVRIDADPSAIRVTIRDQGPGFDDSERMQAFEPFFTTRRNGTGLGLPIARNIARAHGGDVIIAEGGVDGGTVTVTLPRLD